MVSGAFYLLGAVLVILLATLLFKAGALFKMKGSMEYPRGTAAMAEPGRVAGAALCGLPVVIALKSQIHPQALPYHSCHGRSFVITYATLVWRFDLLTEGAAWRARKPASCVLGSRKLGKLMCGIAGIVSMEDRPVFEHEAAGDVRLDCPPRPR